jgi:hypothetical protein
MKGLIEFYTSKLERKVNMLKRLQDRANDLTVELETSELIRLNVLQTEVRLLQEMVEDLKNPY